jgi:hypothetical protein
MEHTNVEAFRRPLDPFACWSYSGCGATAHSGGAAIAELRCSLEGRGQMDRKLDNPSKRQQVMHPELQV